MNKVVAFRNGGLVLRQECVKSLLQNGTYFPGIKKVIFNTTTRKDGSVRMGTCMKFNDGTQTSVVNSSLDTADKEHGVVYCLIKRLMGTVDKNDNINPNEYMGFIRKVVKNAEDQTAIQERIRREKEQIRERNIKEQARIREEAAKRRAGKPTIGERVDRVEMLLNQFCGLLKANLEKSQKSQTVAPKISTNVPKKVVNKKTTSKKNSRKR